jgi:hypothetical protein
MRERVPEGARYVWLDAAELASLPCDVPGSSSSAVVSLFLCTFRKRKVARTQRRKECVLFYFAAWRLCVLALVDSPCVRRLILIAGRLWDRRVAQASRGLIASRLP